MNNQINRPMEIWINEDLLFPNMRPAPLLMHLSPPDTERDLLFWNLLRDKLPELVKIHRFTNLADAGKIVVTPHFISSYYALRKEDELNKFRREVLASKRTLITFSNSMEYEPYQKEIVFASSTYKSKNEKSIPTPQWIYDLGEKAPIPKPSIPTVTFMGHTEYNSRLYSLILSRIKFSDAIINWMAGSLFFNRNLFVINRNLNMSLRRFIARSVRKKTVNEVRKIKNIQASLIEREKEFFILSAEERNRQRAEYIESIENSAYFLTIRGDDNGCYQLWEVMSAGRIPVFIDTNRSLPDLGESKWEDFSIIIPFSEVHRIGDYIKGFHDRLSDEDFAEVCRKSRAVFEQMLPHHFILKILEIIANRTN